MSGVERVRRWPPGAPAVASGVVLDRVGRKGFAADLLVLPRVDGTPGVTLTGRW